MHKQYFTLVKTHFPKSKHHVYKGAKGNHTGQGELKKIRFDPLYSINHVFAMLRDNIKRLARKTWCTTKKLDCLEQHIWVYLEFHNQVLT